MQVESKQTCKEAKAGLRPNDGAQTDQTLQGDEELRGCDEVEGSQAEGEGGGEALKLWWEGIVEQGEGQRCEAKRGGHHEEGEGDLKLTQEAFADLERVKGELQGGAARKDKEGSALAAKINDEATLGSKYAKQAKELQARLEELDEELAVERGNRSKAEKSRTMLK